MGRMGVWADQVREMLQPDARAGQAGPIAVGERREDTGIVAAAPQFQERNGVRAAVVCRQHNAQHAAADLAHYVALAQGVPLGPGHGRAFRFPDMTSTQSGVDVGSCTALAVI